MDPSTHLRHAQTAGEGISAIAADADLMAAVPGMPGYDLASLLIHTGGFCRYVRRALEQGRFPDLDFSDLGGDPRAWHAQEHQRLITTLESIEPEHDGWSWGSDQKARFWFRRAAQELAVHRWDAASAAGDPGPIDPELAADGIDEMLLEFGRRREGLEGSVAGAAEQFAGDGETLHLHATDLDGSGHPGEWIVTARADHFEVRHEHAKGDVALRAPASDLLLFLWGRIADTRVDVFGDRALVERWSARVSV